VSKLTKRAIDVATYEGDGKSRHVLWDSDVNGFGCRIYPTGRKAFVLSFRINGRKRMMTIGSYGALTLDQARKHARAELAKAETSDSDLLEARQQAAKGEGERLTRVDGANLRGRRRVADVQHVHSGVVRVHHQHAAGLGIIADDFRRASAEYAGGSGQGRRRTPARLQGP